MTIEEKAKAYDEAVEKSKRLYEQGTITESLAYIFPELRGDEDEKIRKALVRFHKSTIDIDGIKGADILAWLEKQNSNVDNANKEYWRGYREGKQEILDKYAELEKQGDNKEQINLPCFTFDDVLALQCCMETVKKVQEDKELYEAILILHDKVYDAYHLEKQCEQKPVLDFKASNFYVSKVDGKIHDITYNSTDKVEPKFKVGDFIVNDYCMGRVIEITNDAYLLDTEQGIPFSCEHNVHLWTIQDAKDGDVLHLGCVIAIFKKYIGQEKCICYCSISEDKDFEIPIKNGEDNVYGCIDATPATKEQRDLLFQKMKEAGYEWDAEKKELKKIEDGIEIPFGAKDSELQEATYYIPKGFHAEIDDDKVVIKKGEKSAGWSKDDEAMFQSCTGAIWAADYYLYEDKQDMEAWLKRLKDRIGG